MSSVVVKNLMERRDYTPYCGSSTCTKAIRTVFYKGQFHCGICGWSSNYTESFIAIWQMKWGHADPAIEQFEIAGVDPFRDDLTIEQQQKVVKAIRNNPKLFYKMIGLCTILRKLGES